MYLLSDREPSGGSKDGQAAGARNILHTYAPLSDKTLRTSSREDKPCNPKEIYILWPLDNVPRNFLWALPEGQGEVNLSRLRFRVLSDELGTHDF